MKNEITNQPQRFYEYYQTLITSLEQTIQEYLEPLHSTWQGQLPPLDSYVDSQTFKHRIQAMIAEKNKGKIDDQCSSGLLSFITQKAKSAVVHTQTASTSSDRIDQLVFLFDAHQTLQRLRNEAHLRTQKEQAIQIIDMLSQLINGRPLRVDLQWGTIELNPFEQASHLTSRFADTLYQTVGSDNSAAQCRSRLGQLVCARILGPNVQRRIQIFESAYTEALAQALQMDISSDQAKEDHIQEALHHWITVKNYERVRHTANLLQKQEIDQAFIAIQPYLEEELARQNQPIHSLPSCS